MIISESEQPLLEGGDVAGASDIVARPTEEVVELRIVEPVLAVDLRTKDGMEPKMLLVVAFISETAAAGSGDFSFPPTFTSSLVDCW